MSITVEVEGHSVIVDVPDNSVTVDLIGAPGPAGPVGPAGPAGPPGAGGLDQATADARYVNIDGDTLTGPLLAAGDPTAPLGVATKQYADGRWTRWTGSQAAYDAIPVKDPATLYVIV